MLSLKQQEELFPDHDFNHSLGTLPAKGSVPGPSAAPGPA